MTSVEYTSGLDSLDCNKKSGAQGENNFKVFLKI